MFNPEFECAKHSFNHLINKKTGEFYKKVAHKVTFDYRYNLMLDDCKSVDEVAKKIGSSILAMFSCEYEPEGKDKPFISSFTIDSEKYTTVLQLHTLERSLDQTLLRERENAEIEKEIEFSKKCEILWDQCKKQDEDYMLFLRLQEKYKNKTKN